MQIGPIPLFFAQKRFRWKSKKSAEVLKNLLEKIFRAENPNFQRNAGMFGLKFRKSVGKIKLPPEK
jgi:hypothetical protein